MCAHAVQYTRDRVQSWATERKEKERGELMREQERIHPVPIDNLTPHITHIRTLAPFLQSLLKITVQLSHSEMTSVKSYSEFQTVELLLRSQPNYYVTPGIKNILKC